MSKIVVSSKFKRAFRKFARRNTQLQAQIEKAIAGLSDDIFNPCLGTHKLEGKLSGLLSCSCGYDCRIVFAVETEEESGETLIVLLDVGTHDEVY
ncbi:plasmid stabilization system [Stanieria cyanosphaera PCC 7437]|uniref:Plasmid stabilization system n=1 Tax=Stanieria cyanosphaera (strain ATCC 29371 / PCC 7437) TaxID=111780 RepID=K9XU23_STAC7|nr:type II toxin-antitoxin system mRNA interferase toxin, RelE/StbE family [Stanieria cyanosphaera]AFZ35177.1 plasmid stabilization system [Stanieria cyanosphaera PCC 7437]